MFDFDPYFAFEGILRHAVVKSVLPMNNFGGVKHIFTLRAKCLPWGFSNFVLVLILWQSENGKIRKMSNFHDFREFWNLQSWPGSLIFQNFQNPNYKNLAFQVKICFAKKIYLRVEQILQRPILNFIKKPAFFGCGS